MKNEEQELLKPKTDVVFKAIFTSEKGIEALESFLRAVLNIPLDKPIKIKIINPITNAEKKDDKTSIIDVRVETDKEIINVEIQVNSDPTMRDRIVFGVSKTVTNQKTKGENYKLKKVISIVITGYKLIQEHQEYHDIFNYASLKTGCTFSKSTEIHTLELPKLPKEDDRTMLWNWLKFIKSEKKEEFEMLAQKDSGIDQAVSILKDISQDEAMRMLAHNREMAEWSLNGRLQATKEEGLEQKAHETAVELLKMGLSLENISQAVKMPIDWVEQLQIDITNK